MSRSNEYSHALDIATEAAREAGEAILDYYNANNATVYEKTDGSAVTDADLAADRIIRERVGGAFPADAFLTEEGADDRVRLSTERVWIVDPIDGTNQFVNRTGEFEVLIALVVGQRPVAAVVYQPTGDVLIRAVAGEGAEIQVSGSARRLRFSPVAEGSAPRLLTSTWLGARGNLPVLGSVAQELGGAEVLVSDIGVTVRRFVPPNGLCDALIGVHVDGRSDYAWEWDFAAPDLIMFEAGGAASDLHGHLHRYNKPNPVNAGGIVMAADPETHQRVIAALATVLKPDPAGAA
ncbi:MAG: 3'(2'),5'-bisphosphate nucleotidase CysQ [Thermomicrobiales bacterium]